MSEQKQHSLWFHLADITLNIVIIVAIVAVIRTFLISPFQVDGRSMVPTLENSQYIVINKLIYFLQPPKRGEIVVFRPPTNNSTYYVKRVVAQGGDTITLQGGNVYLTPAGETKEFKLDETYLSAENAGYTCPQPQDNCTNSQAKTSFTVPEGQYFLMGDNRRGSSDSRSFKDTDGDPIPFVPANNIKGRVWFVALPLKAMHALEQAHYIFQTNPAT